MSVCITHNIIRNTYTLLAKDAQFPKSFRAHGTARAYDSLTQHHCQSTTESQFLSHISYTLGAKGDKS